MIYRTNANLQALSGGLRVNPRVQHPQVKVRKDREGKPWVFRYRFDVIQSDGSLKTSRKYQSVGLSVGPNAITKKQAEVERDQFMAKLNAPTVEAAEQQVAVKGVALFGEVAKQYQEGYLSRKNQIAKPTRDKEQFYLDKYLIPKWGSFRLIQIQPKAVEDWLHSTFDSWWTMHGVRGIMSRIFYYAEGHGLWEEGKRSPASKAKLGRRSYKNERRILTFNETARVLGHIDEPNKLVIETCIATGARISEVLGLQWRHINLTDGTIKIEQRVWHQEVGRPKSEESRRILGLGNLVARFQAKAIQDAAKPKGWVFYQKNSPDKPLWDSGVRDALHQAAKLEECDFRGLGLHSFRRANITWRQQVGGSAIEASKIAGHSNLETTAEYTFVTPDRQNELTRRIQDKLDEASQRNSPKTQPVEPPPSTTEAPPSLASAEPLTTTVQ